MLHTWVYLCVFVPVFIAIPPTKPYAIFCVLHHFISVLYLSTYILCLDVQAYPPIYWLTPRRYRGSKYWSNIIMSGTEWSFRHCYYPSTFTCMSLFSSEIFTTYCACVVCVCPLSDICHASLYSTMYFLYSTISSRLHSFSVMAVVKYSRLSYAVEMLTCDINFELL